MCGCLDSLITKETVRGTRTYRIEKQLFPGESYQDEAKGHTHVYLACFDPQLLIERSGIAELNVSI